MQVKIKDVQGYQITYDTDFKRFELRTPTGELEASAPTQVELENKAIKLSKATFSPIEAYYDLDSGRITSVNLDEQEVWFSYDKQTNWQTRTKVFLKYATSLYAKSPNNDSIKTQIDTRAKQIAKLNEEITELLKKWDSPLTLEYFKNLNKD